MFSLPHSLTPTFRITYQALHPCFPCPAPLLLTFVVLISPSIHVFLAPLPYSYLSYHLSGPPSMFSLPRSLTPNFRITYQALHPCFPCPTPLLLPFVSLIRPSIHVFLAPLPYS